MPRTNGRAKRGHNRMHPKMRALVMFIEAYVASGGKITALATKAGVTYQTLLNWRTGAVHSTSLAKAHSVLRAIGHELGEL